MRQVCPSRCTLEGKQPTSTREHRHVAWAAADTAAFVGQAKAQSAQFGNLGPERHPVGIVGTKAPAPSFEFAQIPGLPGPAYRGSSFDRR